MKLATATYNGASFIIGKVGEEVRRLNGVTSMIELIERGRPFAEGAFGIGTPIAETALTFQAPIPQPGKIIAVGQNYMDHIREQNGTPPTKPLLFTKMPSSVIPTGALIQWDTEVATFVDYEVELAVVIGKTCRLVAPESVTNYVYGYLVVNDVTARDLQKGDGQWTRAKGMDTFCPMGAWLTTADEIPDPQALALRTTVNGETRQNSRTNEMIFDVKTLISYISQAFTLQAGDVILTGTPDGVGAYRKPPIALKDGDTVVCEVEGVGRVENLCRTLKFRLT
ncbi:MAG TPA: fumarylacetoacetate hydrolase family protein [Aggregatilineales bacterium]|nr:fumarylacetoacetate hydrolase family protein [Anaerolineales bacterium]HRE47852.1 fumarylacetoacetate hydrolase family protein [Aggregatilineales bacterium]